MSGHKYKTHKGLQKRVRVTAKRKVKRKATFGGHLMSGKSGKRRRKLRKMVVLGQTETRRTLTALGL